MKVAPEDYSLLDPAVIEDPYPFYRSLLAHAPIYRVPDTRVYLVASWALIHEVLRNQRDYSANLTGVLVSNSEGGPELFDFTRFGGSVDALANADEPFHAVHRKLVLPQLTARRVAGMEGEVREWARARVAALLGSGGGDAVVQAANPIPVKVMARLAGLPVEDVDLLLTWAFAGGDILAGTVTVDELAQLGTSTAELSAYLREHLQPALDRELHEPCNVIEELARGVRRGLITEQEAIGILVVLVGAAGESTSSLMGSAIRLLAEDSSLQQRLRQDPGLIAAFVEEVVRLESPFKGHYRALLQPTELGGVALDEGCRLLLLWAAANRDPAVFNAPDQLLLSRADGREHLGFGHGIHFCIGARLARMETRVLLEELLAKTTAFALDARQPPRHVPSIFVRRLSRLALSVQG